MNLQEIQKEFDIKSIKTMSKDTLKISFINATKKFAKIEDDLMSAIEKKESNKLELSKLREESITSDNNLISALKGRIKYIKKGNEEEVKEISSDINDCIKDTNNKLSALNKLISKQNEGQSEDIKEIIAYLDKFIGAITSERRKRMENPSKFTNLENNGKKVIKKEKVVKVKSEPEEEIEEITTELDDEDFGVEEE